MNEQMRAILDEELRDQESGESEEGGCYTEIILDADGNPVCGDDIDREDDSRPRLCIDRETAAFVAMPAVWDALGVEYEDDHLQQDF